VPHGRQPLDQAKMQAQRLLSSTFVFMFTWRSRCLEAVCSWPGDDDETDQELARVLCCHPFLSASSRPSTHQPTYTAAWMQC